MTLEDERKRLPIVVGGLPEPDDRMIRQGPGESPRPRYAVWEVTLKCDQKCIHCGSRGGPQRPGELTTEEAQQLVRELRALGVGEVTILGGEAYLRNDFIRILRTIREEGMTASMVTGGLNLTRERADAMAEAGVVSVSVSIDGMEAAHDELRGVPGSWQAAFRAIANLQGAGIPVSTNTQINRLSMSTLPELIETLGRAGIFGWQLQITAPFGAAADHPEILLQPYMYPELFELLDRVVARAGELGIKIWPGNNLGYFGPMESKLRRFAMRDGHYKGCTAGRYAIGLEADGTIKGCPSLGGPANIAGRWRPGMLEAIWNGSGAIRYTRERGLSHLWGYCKDCYYADVCKGGCTAAAEPLMGRPGNNPFCHHRALELQREGQRERIELVQKAPGEPFDHGLYRIIREWSDPARRDAEGPIEVVEPRVGRELEPDGAGRPVAG